MVISTDAASKENLRPGSNRSFGFVFAAFFAIVALWPLWHGAEPRWFVLALAGAFLLVALTFPKLLRPLNYVWFRFGLLLHSVVTPLLMGLIFVLGAIPIGLLMRMFGNRPLDLDLDRTAKTYWIVRPADPRGADAMRDQY